MSRKIPVHLTIDENIYLYYRFYKRDTNLSAMVNDYLAFMMKANKEDGNTDHLEEELAKLKEEQVKASERAAAIMLELNNRKEEAERLSKEELAKALVMHDTVRNSDFLRNLD